jgi:hypothetical protein
MPPAIGSAIAAGPAPRRTRRSPPPSPQGKRHLGMKGSTGAGPTIFKFKLPTRGSSRSRIPGPTCQGHCAASAAAGGTRQLEGHCTALSLGLMPPATPSWHPPVRSYIERPGGTVTRCLAHAPGRGFARLHGGGPRRPGGDVRASLRGCAQGYTICGRLSSLARSCVHHARPSPADSLEVAPRGLRQLARASPPRVCCGLS